MTGGIPLMDDTRGTFRLLAVQGSRKEGMPGTCSGIGLR